MSDDVNEIFKRLMDTTQVKTNEVEMTQEQLALYLADKEAAMAAIESMIPK